MSLKYNFAFKYSDLLKWKPRDRNKDEEILSIEKKIKLIIQYIKNNPIVFYPNFILILVSILIQLANIYPSFLIRKLENKHQQYLFLTQRIKKIDNDINIFRNQLENIKPNFTAITPTYLFTFYIQNSIPVNIQLESYKINKNNFFIKANSYSLKAINEMILLLIESPIIDKKSVLIKKIKREQDIDEKILVEITGKILKTNLATKESLYRESSAFGLLEKLSRFKKTNTLLRK